MNIIIVYNSKYGTKVGEMIGKITEHFEEEKIIIEGDFNIRIGELGEEKEEWATHRGKVKIIS